MSFAKLRSAFAAAAALGVGLSGGGAIAGSYTLITPYAGVGATTSVLGVNDAGYLTGTIFSASGSADGFIRDPAGVYTLFNDGFNTIGRNISNTNTITGYATDATFNLRTDTEFQRSAGGAFATISNPVTAQPLHGIAQGQNASGVIVGDNFYTSGGLNYRHGYAIDGSTFTDISAGPSNVQKTTTRGINDSGVIVGWNLDASTGVTQGYVDVGGTLTFFSDPNPLDASTTYFEDINNNGLVSGDFADAGGLLHPFEFNTLTNTFTDLNPPGANFAAFGLNNAGEIVLTDGNGLNYLYNPAGTPEPATWAVMLLGLGFTGAALRWRKAPPLVR